MPARTHTWIHVSATTILALVIVALALPQIASAQLSMRRPAGRAYSVPFSLVDSGQELGGSSSWKVSLAGADNDGDLDAFVSNWNGETNEHGKLWLNAGDGTFNESSQQFPSCFTGMNAGDLDAVLFDRDHIGESGPNRVLLNNGRGRFADWGLDFGDSVTAGGGTGDLDGDGDLDVFTANVGVDGTLPNGIWINTPARP